MVYFTSLILILISKLKMIQSYSSVQNFSTYKDQLDKYFELNYGMSLPPRDSNNVGSQSGILKTESRKFTLPILAPSPVKHMSDKHHVSLSVRPHRLPTRDLVVDRGESDSLHPLLGDGHPG